MLEVLDDDRASLSRVTNGLGEQWFIESDLLESLVFGSELRRFTEVQPVRKLLYPYKGGQAISELELRERYPRAQEYLWAYRDILSARSSLRGTGAAHYELIRPRDERWLRRPKLLIRDLAPTTAFAADVKGAAFLVGGTAVVPADPEHTLPLLAYLNSPLISRFAEQQAPAFKNDFFKFEPGVLSGIPILKAMIESEETMQELGELSQLRLDIEALGSNGSAVEAAIDDLIARTAQSVGVDLVA